MVDLQKINLNLLVSLNVLLQEKNVTHAAKKLFLSQSAVSTNLKQLRKIFKDDLLVREKNKLLLTNYAKDLKPKLEKTLQELKGLIEEKNKFNIFYCQNTFKIAMQDQWSSSLLVKLMPILKTQAPNLKINIIPITQIYNAKPFQKEVCDISIARTSALPDEIHKQLLSNEGTVCILGSKHPLAKKKKITLKEYLACKHISWRVSNPDFSSAIDESLLERTGKKRDTVLSLVFIDSVFRVVEQSDYLVASISKSAAQLIQNKYKCIIKEFPIKIPDVGFYICWHKRLDDDLAHQWLRNQLIAMF